MDRPLSRDRFPVTRRWAFFDHAAVAPLTAPTQQAIADYAADLAENGVASFHRWADRVRGVRALAGRLINADPLDVAFVANTSTGLNLVAEGFPWRPGDNVVIAEEEYPANQYPWLNLRDRGVEVRRVPSRGSRILIDDVAATIDGRTRVVSLSWVEFASGFRNDLDALGSLCRERGVLFCVDAIQGLGVLPLDVRRSPIDFLAADGHKWLLGPEGAGVVWARPEVVERLRAVGIGWHSVVGAWDFAAIDFRLKPNAGRWEGGSFNIAGITGLGASLELLLDAGIPAVAGRVLGLTDYLCDRAARAGLEVFSSRRGDDRSGIVSLTVPDPAGAVKRCRAAGVIVNHRCGRLRVSPHAYNTEDEIDRLIECLSASATSV
jgi:selenocysteine lyase/cysteine desulfurase